MLGKTRADVAGKTYFDLFPSDRAANFQELDRKVLETGVPEQLEVETHLTSGKRLTFLGTKFPIRDEHASLCGMHHRHGYHRAQAGGGGFTSERVMYRTLQDAIPTSSGRAMPKGSRPT